MGCNSPGATHHLACDCREDAICKEVAGLRERLAASEKAREEADAYAGRANARIADLGERLDATEAVLRAAEKAREEAERERDEARICIQIVRDRIERILAAWMRPPGGQEAGVPDKSISPQTCRELLRSLTAEQGSYTYEEWCRTTEAKAAAESRAARLLTALREIADECDCDFPRCQSTIARAALGEEGK